jgi:hypothetical protein
MNKISLLLMCVACAGASQAQPIASAAQDPNLSCIKALELPTRGLIAVMGESGTVNARIHINSRGGVRRLELRGGDTALQAEVRVAIGMSNFLPRCAGQTVNLVFAFKLEYPAVADITPPGVRFRPPNRFDLVFRHRKTHLQLAPPPPPPVEEEQQPKP